jgi:hypothetical protein
MTTKKKLIEVALPLEAITWLERQREVHPAWTLPTQGWNPGCSY